jgi:hypothetical protein
MKAGVIRSSVVILDKIERVGDKIIHAKDDLINVISNLTHGSHKLTQDELEI